MSYFSDIEDFRMVNKCNHLLSDILLIGLFTYLSNGEDYEDMVLFAENHPDFVREYCQLPNGVPSHDTFNRVFSSLDTSVLNKCLMDCGKAILDTLSEKQAYSNDCFSEQWEYSSARFETRKCRILQAKDVLLDENLSVWGGTENINSNRI